MNKIKLLAVLAVASLSIAVQAQRSLDTFAAPVTVQLGTPATIAPGNTSLTNGPYDLKWFDGIAKIDVVAVTNASASLANVALYASNDQTNIALLANYALGTAKSVIYTNYYYGGTNGLKATNPYIVAGSWTTPSVVSAGFASPYLVANAFTNSASINLQSGVTTIGFDIGDAPRYLYVVYTGTNYTAGAVLTAHTHSGTLQ